MMRSVKLSLRFLFCLGMLVNIARAAEPEPIVIVGFQYEYDESNFSNSGKTRTIRIPVHGVTNGPFLYDIDAFVTGKGHYDLGFRCNKFFVQPGGFVMIGAGNPPDCDTVSVNPSNQYHFEVSMSVECGGSVIGSSSDHKNRLLTEAEVTNIRNRANSYLDRGQYILPSLYPTQNSINLQVDRDQFQTEEACEELVVTLKGIQTTIETIDLDVIIGQEF